MTPIRRMSVFGLAVLLAAATAAADTTTTTREVLSPSVESADTARAAQLPELQAAPDSGVSVVPPRATVDTTRTHAEAIDTLNRGASPNLMVAKCREMDVALRKWGQGTDTVAKLLREVQREEWELRRIWPPGPIDDVNAPAPAVPHGYGRAASGGLIDRGRPEPCYDPPCLKGCVGDFVVVFNPTGSGRARLLAAHRARVNRLVRRVNRAILAAP